MSDEKDIKIDESYKSIFNIDSINKGKGDGIQLSSPDGEIVQPEQKKRGRKKKETTNKDDGTETVVVNQISSRELSMAQTNVPYSSTYDETNNQQLIGQDIAKAVQIVTYDGRTLSNEYIKETYKED